MKCSTDRILTTHAGSLPRPAVLTQAIVGHDRGTLGPDEAGALPTQIRDAVATIAKSQAEAGVDIINDGEASKIGYSTYVRERLSGFSGKGRGLTIWDLHDVPEFAQRSLAGLDPQTPACTGPIVYQGRAALEEDIVNLRTATEELAPTELFMTAASPGVISIYLENQYYPTDKEYWEAIAEAMRLEYEAIVAGVELLNHACSNIPSDRIRLHLCWGNYHGPHHHDVPLGDLIDIFLRTKSMALSFEAANPRHQHEWRIWEDVALPDDKILIPGVIDTCTSYVEHPQLVAERIGRFAGLVGRDRVIAGTDCGFANFASYQIVDPKIAWMKLAALSERADLASRHLWNAGRTHERSAGRNGKSAALEAQHPA
jgi:5-methyltetrahydropteroyltriglutamate--homocysteine methyltransferase